MDGLSLNAEFGHGCHELQNKGGFMKFYLAIDRLQIVTKKSFALHVIVPLNAVFEDKTI